MNDKANKAPDLPKGMEMVSDGSLANTHDFKADPVVMGPVVAMKVVPVRRGSVMQDNRLMTIDVGDKQVAVWESANLKDLFDRVEVGGTVYIKLTGQIDLNNGLNPMKQFVTGYQPPGV